MTRYKFDPRAGLVDQDGKIILQLVAVGCSKSFRVTAGKELANKLNGTWVGWVYAPSCPHEQPKRQRIVATPNTEPYPAE